MEMDLPVELSYMLLVFLERGHSATCSNRPFVFTKRDGMPMEQSQDMSHYWYSLQTLIGCSSQFGPHR